MLCILVVGCGIYRARPASTSVAAHDDEGGSESASRSRAPAEPEVAATAAPEAITDRMHFVLREGPTVMECADITQRITPPDPLPENWTPPSLGEYAATFPGFAGRELTTLAERCADALSEPAFGQCEVSMEGSGEAGLRFELSATLLYYGAGVVERDRRPRECEELDGDWEWLE